MSPNPAISKQLQDAASRFPGAPAGERLAAEADGRGLVDVAWATFDSPLGRLLLATTERGLVLLAYESDRDPLEILARRVSPRILELPARLDGPRRQLDEYFAGRRQDFELALDWSPLAGFTRRVLEATARIPFGRVSTYRAVATEAGSPQAVRAAGNALGANPLPIVVPCHRVLRTGGGLGGYTGGLDKKERLLRLEGVA